MSLALQLVRPESYGMFDSVCGSFHPFRMSRFHSVPVFYRNNGKLRVPFQKSADTPLILLRGKGTGRIDKSSADRQHLCRIVQDLILSFRTHCHVFGAPLNAGLLIFSEHPLPRTGSIHQDSVKISRKMLSENIRGMIHHDGIGDPHSLNIFR